MRSKHGNREARSFCPTSNLSSRFRSFEAFTEAVLVIGELIRATNTSGVEKQKKHVQKLIY